MTKSPTNPWMMPAMLTFTSLIRPDVGTVRVDSTPVLLSSGMAAAGELDELEVAGPALPVGRLRGTA